MRISDWSSDVCSSDLPNVVAISAFTDHMIEPGRGRGIGVKGLVSRPDVSRKEQARRPGFQFYRGGTEYVSRVPKPEPEIGRKRDPAFKLDAPGLGIGGHRIRLGVDRRHRLLVRPVGAAVAPLGLAFLYASGVRQHVIKQVAGGGGAPYRAAIALGHKLGQQPAVIDMGVAEEDRKSVV